MKFLNLICFLFFVQSMNAQTLLSKKVSECDEMGGTELKINRIYNKEMVNDTLVIKLSYVANCCASHSLKHEFRSDTLFLVQNARNSISVSKEISGNDTLDVVNEIVCACTCYYFETLKFGGISDTNIVVNWNGQILPISKGIYFSVPDDSFLAQITTRNQVNEAGVHVGLWEIRHENSKKIKHLLYYGVDLDGEQIVVWTKSFDKKGNLVSVSVPGYELDASHYYRLQNQTEQQCWPDE